MILYILLKLLALSNDDVINFKQNTNKELAENKGKYICTKS